MTKIDLHQVITDQIIAHIEGGTLPWHRDWKAGAAVSLLPQRANGQFYRGINVLLLWIAQEKRGFSSAKWMTFKQAQAVGANVRKGEKGTQIVFFSTFEKQDLATGEDVKIPFLKGYTVFNADQIEGLPCTLTPDMFGDDDLPAVDPIAAADAFFAASGAQIINSGRNPCYIPALDQIHMPKMGAFETAGGYYATLAHELVHWTGHKSRLDRFTDGAKTAYAFEELVAELGACFLLPSMGLEPNTANSAAYVQSWLRALRNDKKFIFQAASAAQKAIDFLGECAAQPSAIAA